MEIQAPDCICANTLDSNLQQSDKKMNVIRPYQDSNVFIYPFQEWHLMCSHYIILTAFKGFCQSLEEELFCQQNGEYTL